MREFLKRVVQEKQDLDVRIASLRRFLAGPGVGELSKQEITLLKIQADVMEEYSCVLCERVKYYKSEGEV